MHQLPHILCTYSTTIDFDSQTHKLWYVLLCVISYQKSNKITCAYICNRTYAFSWHLLKTLSFVMISCIQW